MTPQREYAVIEIAADGEAAFKALERRMGVPLAGNDTGEPENAWWFAASEPDGRTRRAFSFPSRSRVELTGLLGNLGSPLVRFTLGYADLTAFRVEGPGAEKASRRSPPVLLPHLIDRLYPAAHRQRLR